MQGLQETGTFATGNQLLHMALNSLFPTWWQENLYHSLTHTHTHFTPCPGKAMSFDSGF